MIPLLRADSISFFMFSLLDQSSLECKSNLPLFHFTAGDPYIVAIGSETSNLAFTILTINEHP